MRADDLNPDKQSRQAMPSVQCYTTAQYPCSYLPDMQARSLVAVLAHEQATASYDTLITQGFRRSGSHFYRPNCDACQSCVPTRIRVADFAPTRSQRRAYKALNELTIKQMPVTFEPEHWALYQRYQAARHTEYMDDGSLANIDAHTQQAYAQFLARSPVNSTMLELRHKWGNHAGKLYAVSVLDRVADGLSAVYTFFEPDNQYTHGSPGTACVMWLVEQAKTLGLPYVYLGYWIEQSRKMAYKSNFKPLERLQNGQWHSP